MDTHDSVGPTSRRFFCLLRAHTVILVEWCRIGPPGRLALVGASASWEREKPGAMPFVLLPTRVFEPIEGTPLSGRYTSHRTTRINALFGLRNIRFMQVSGFESLDGFQDVRQWLRGWHAGWAWY
jgi:hypothetical protein